ncbi:cytochrome c [Sedimenticola sp.]|uniref:cytochrome c n=1 Tax=Sedimenticola sp. TaxID=1940285 RepID=UPI003D0AEA65
MRLKFALIGTALLLGLPLSQAAAFDLAAGQAQYEENCTSCHGSEVYTRKDRRVTSRKGLSAQVQRCQLALNLNWFDDEVENTAEFLNRNFYHFSQ